MPVVSTCDRIRIVVSDPERAAAWLEQVLGATGRDGGRAAIGSTVFVFATPAGSGEAGSAPAADEVGACHVCVGVPDVRESYHRLARLDVRTSTPPVELLPGLWSVYFVDGDGVRYQLLERPGAQALHHFAYSVSDLDRTVAWYESVFGVVPSYRGEASGELVARTLEVDDGAYRVALVPLADAQVELLEWQSGRPRAPGGRSGLVGDWSLGLSAAAPPEPGSGRRADGGGRVEIADPDGMRLELGSG